MNPIDLDSVRRATVVAPHPDDEVIAAFGLIHTLRRRGIPVNVTVVTDGAASHRNSARWPAPRLRATRRAESIRALARAGVHRAGIRFLRFADGSLRGCDQKKLRELASELGRAPTPDILILPSTSDDHPDHRAVARAAAMTWRRCERRFAYIVWPRAADRAPAMTHSLYLGATVRAMKRSAILCHKSQAGMITDDPEGFRLTAAMIARFTKPIERFRLLP